MATGAKKKRTRAKPIWERGYKSHGYWQSGKKLGVVQLVDSTKPSTYHWEAGKYHGDTATLREAKLAVEQAVLKGIRQLDLFDQSDA